MFDFLTPLGWLPAILFIIGFLLLCVEMLIPGFGVPGILGIIAALAGVILQAQTFVEALFYILVIIVIATILMFVVSRSIKKGRLSHTLVLKDVPDTGEGFRSAKDFSAFLGKAGEALTPLHPAGMALIDDERVDVVSDSEYIEKGEKVRVTLVQGRRVLVRRDNINS